MTTEQRADAVERLREIQYEMAELLDEAKRLVRRAGDELTARRAESYWVAHIACALSDDHRYLGNDGCTMAATIGEIEADGEGW